MIIPAYWAEAKTKHRDARGQRTFRRFGWSSESQAAALAHAESRAQEALQAYLSGERPQPWEDKVPYNGAEGLPIREEILAVEGSSVVTRNGYGAHCLNTPNVFIADIDFGFGPLARDWLVAFAISATLGAALVVRVSVFLGLFAFVAGPIVVIGLMSNLLANWRKERWAFGLVRKFATKHSDWRIRIYRTPAGLRLLAVHKLFEPQSEEVHQAFRELHTDPTYASMCRRQNCFRARLTPKPWRMGMKTRMRPRPGVWPVNPDRMHLRNEWIARYESQRAGFAACKFLVELGSQNPEHEDAMFVAVLHDELSGATSGRPIA